MYCRQHPETGIVKFEEVCQVDSLDLLEHSMWLDKQTDPRLFRYWKETGLPEYPYFWYVVKVDDGASPMTSVRALLTTGAFVLDQSDIRSMKSILNVSISLGLSSQIAGKATFGECWEFRLRGASKPPPIPTPAFANSWLVPDAVAAESYRWCPGVSWKQTHNKLDYNYFFS